MKTGTRYPARSAIRLTPAAGVLGILVLLTGAAHAAIFPDHLGAYQRLAPKTIGIPDQELYDEYGLEATESADYTSPGKKPISATAWRLHNTRLTWPMAIWRLTLL